MAAVVRSGEDAYTLNTGIVHDAILHACRDGNAAGALASCASTDATAAYIDAVARDDLRSVRLLLDAAAADPTLRLDLSASDGHVSHPALYPALRGSLPMLRLLASVPGCIPPTLEEALLAAATTGAGREPHRAADFTAVRGFIEGYVLDSLPLEALPAARRGAKVRRACARHEVPAGSGKLPTAAIPAVAAALNTLLSPAEAWEVAVALTSKHASPPTAVSSEALVEFWVGSSGASQ